MKTNIDNIEFEAIELLEYVSIYDQVYSCQGHDDEGNKYEGIANVSCDEIVEVSYVKL